MYLLPLTCTHQDAQGCRHWTGRAVGCWRQEARQAAGLLSRPLNFQLDAAPKPGTRSGYTCTCTFWWRLRAVSRQMQKRVHLPANTRHRVPDGAWRVHLISRRERLQKSIGHAASSTVYLWRKMRWQCWHDACSEYEYMYSTGAGTAGHAP